MKTKRQLVLITAAFGVLAYVADACLDSTILHQGSIWTLLAHPPSHDMFTRAEAAVAFMLFGMVVFRIVGQREKAQQALQETEAKYRGLVEESLFGVYIIQDGRFKYVNPRFAEIFGYTQDEIVGGKTVMDLAAPEDRERITTNLRKRMDGTLEDIHYTYAGLRKDGDPVKVEVHGSRAVYMGEPAVIGSLLDITERVRAEEILKLTQTSVDQAADAVFWIKPDARLIYVNHAACRSLGYTCEELLTLTIHDIDPAFPKDVWDASWEELRRKGSLTFETVHRAKDGRIFPVEITANHLTFDGKEYNAAFARDITERKAIEEDRVRLTNLMHVLLESTDQGIYGLDIKGRCTFANAAAAKMLGYSQEELVGVDVHEVIHCRRKDGTHYPKDECPAYEVLRTGRGVRTDEEALWRKDGTSFPAEFSSSPIIEAGELKGAVVAFTDITVRKMAEEVLRREYERERTIAETLQMSFLPAVSVQVEGYGIHERYKAALKEAEIGGDFYDVFRLHDGRMALVMGDVSGKGLQSAVHTAMAKYMLRAYAHENPEPSYVLEHLNAALSDFMPADSFITIFYGALDPARHTLAYANAGHEPPLLYSASHKLATQLAVTGMAVGVMHGGTFDRRLVDILPGDALLIYTDGITEARTGRDFFGIEGVEEALRAASEKNEAGIADAIFEAASNFGGGNLRDDAAVLVVKAR